jgi:hypothetical protein
LVLVKREAGVPVTDGGADQFSLDQLFLDAAGVPTLIEVKKSTNTEIRRRVVGQMLDYAANGVRYWPAARLRAMFEATCKEADRDPDEALAGLLGEDLDVDAYWLGVAKNLEAGRLRLLFVADRIPPELQRIIEFLNEQMTAAEVLGIEVTQYRDSDVAMFVPRVLGRTAQAAASKDRSAGKTTFREMLEQASDEIRGVHEQLLEFFEAEGVGHKDAPQSRAWVPPHGANARLWLGSNELTINTSNLGLEGVELIERLEAITRRPHGKKRPSVTVNELIENWEQIRDEVLRPFVRASPPTSGSST